MDDNDRERSRLDHVRDFCANTTAHGLARVAVAKSWPARLFWIVIITFASTVCVVQIGRSVQAYFEYRTKTDIFLVNKEQYRFPAVTICNINPFKRSKIETTPIMNGLKQRMNDGDFENAKEAIKNNALANITDSYSDKARDIGHQGEELIVQCMFPGNHQHLSCSHRNFSHYFDMLYGNCFTYNGSNASVTEPGHRQGFKLLLFIDLDEYTAVLADSVGALVAIHSPYVEPEIDENSIFVAPGSAVFVSMLVENVTLKDYPYNAGNCSKNISYSQTRCLRNCVADQMKRDCGCVPVVMRQQPICDFFNDQQAQCLEANHKKGFGSCPCDPPCNRLHFRHTVSNSLWPSKVHMPHLSRIIRKTEQGNIRNITNLEKARENMVQVNVHFASMQMQHIKQSAAITEETLMGDIGGQLGLFIGISCITLIEFFDLLWRLISQRKKTAPNQVRAFEVAER